MQFYIIASTLLALAAASPVPVDSSSAPEAQTLDRRQVRCVITGYEGDQISSNAPASGVAGTAALGSLSIQCDDGHKWDNGNKMPNSQTIKAKDTKFAEDVHWKQTWRVGGYVSCSVSYGKGNPTIPGKVGAHDLSLTVGAGSTDTQTCAAEFFV